MADFHDRDAAQEGGFYWEVPKTDTNYWWCFPRQLRARELEQQPARRPRAILFVNGGSGAASGETVFDAGSVDVRMGFEDDSADRVLAFSMLTATVPKSSVTNAPVPGHRLWAQFSTDARNYVNMFHGQVEQVRESPDGMAYEVIAFDDVRRMQDFPFSKPVTFTDVDGTYVDDYDETTLEASVQIQVSELLSAADVLTHSLTGIEQYPMLPSNRRSVYEELTTLLRASHCRAYLSPTGRLLVTYTDEMPLWAVALMNDLGARPKPGGVGSLKRYPSTRFHLPLVGVRAVFPDRVIAQHEYVEAPSQWPTYPNQYVSGDGPWTMPPFEFSPHNVAGIERADDSAIVNQTRAQTTPDDDTRDFIDLSAMTFEDLETLTFSQIGDASVSGYMDGASVAEYGLRSRSYDSGSLAEVSRATKTPTGPPGTTQPSINYGRFARYRGDFSESNVRARRFPAKRIRVTAPGILSLLPFEVVSVNLPDEGVNGYFQVEARRLQLSGGGFRSVDTLRAMELPGEIVTLDARDEEEVTD